jgi:hypothetical protein
MFDGEKTTIFYLGLFIFGGALVGLFYCLWFMAITAASSLLWKILPPFAFGAIVFMVIGYILMRTGVRKPPPES